MSYDASRERKVPVPADEHRVFLRVGDVPNLLLHPRPHPYPRRRLLPLLLSARTPGDGRVGLNRSAPAPRGFLLEKLFLSAPPALILVPSELPHGRRCCAVLADGAGGGGREGRVRDTQERKRRVSVDRSHVTAVLRYFYLRRSFNIGVEHPLPEMGRSGPRGGYDGDGPPYRPEKKNNVVSFWIRFFFFGTFARAVHSLHTAVKSLSFFSASLVVGARVTQEDLLPRHTLFFCVLHSSDVVNIAEKIIISSTLSLVDGNSTADPLLLASHKI